MPISPTVVRRWYKRMSRADAQRPNAGTNPTGHLTFTRNRFPIDQVLYFGTDFFKDLAWGSSSLPGKGREEATIPVEVVIDATPLGTHRLTVDHNPRFESDQRNRTVVLRWGDTLNEHLRKNDLTGRYATVERLSDGSCRLVIDHAPAGKFIR